jgi:bifunctional DNase/RNase
MKRKLVKVLGLSYSQSQTGSYVLILSENKGKGKLPIIIKPNEAQRIALESEGIKSPRPLTHDLLKSMTDSYGVNVKEVYIYSLAEGIFYAKMITEDKNQEVEIECSVGDSVILSYVYKCPIYVAMSVMNAAGVYMNDDGTPVDVIEEDEVVEEETKSVVSIENLERALEDAVRNEEYELAVKVRDRINELKEKNEL